MNRGAVRLTPVGLQWNVKAYYFAGDIWVTVPEVDQLQLS